MENVLLTPEQLIKQFELEIQPSTLKSARTSGMVRGMPAPPFVRVFGKPRYRYNDVLKWIEGFTAYASNAEHEAALTA